MTLIIFSGAGLGLAGWILSNGISGAAARAQQVNISPEAVAQIKALIREKQSRAGAQLKMDSQLIYELKMRRGAQIAEGVRALETDIPYNGDGKAVLDLKANISDALLSQLRTHGADIINSVPDHNSVRIQIDINQIEAIAALPDVSYIQPKQDAMLSQAPRTARTFAQTGTPQRGVVNDREPGMASREARVRRMLSGALQTNVGTGVGSQSAEGDVTHRASAARGTFNVDGTGIKIGVLSDGVTNLAASQASGDLGPVTVLPGQAGAGDEGTAMLEIIHDMAPGAQLFFATALGGITSFAQNIRDLRAAGCDIIVDDIFYFVETPFQDGQAPSVVSNTNGGVVTQAVNDVTASGALYFSSAGNSGNLNDGSSGVWEGNFVDGGDAGGILEGAGRIHDFGGQLFTIQTAPGSSQINLYWSDPLGGSSNDYDLFRLNSNGTAVTGSSTNTQDGTQDPFEAMGQPSAVSLYVIVKVSGEDRFLHLNTNRGLLSIATAGQTHGHSSAANAFSCAATPAGPPFGLPPNPTGPFPNPFNASNVVELFSSDGPRRIFYQADGTPITPGDFLATGGLLRQKPDITAADGVAVTGVGGFGSPFYGTSAAAPSAAAIAGLLKSANPSLTPAQIRTALTSSAIDIEGPGVDRDSGAGILDAFAAMQFLGVPGFAYIESGAIAATESNGDGNGQIDPGETGNLAVQLKNTGVLDATGITATLTTSTPGVIITPPGASDYPDLPPLSGSGTNAAPFLFSLAGDVPCSLMINFTLTVSYTGGASADPKVFNFTVQTGPPPIGINSTIDTTAPAPGPGFTATTGTIGVRHFRDGVPSDCGSAKPFPGTTNPGTRQYDAYTFETCPTSTGGCVTVTLSGAGAINLFSAAYSGNFNPNDLSEGYLADAGSSSANGTYSFNIPPGQQTFTVVVTDVPVGPPSGIGYTLNVAGACIGACPQTPFQVTTTVPGDGSIISAPPTTFTVNISEPADPASLQASDFTVNGIAASGVSYTPGSATIDFTFGSSPVTTEGAQTMSIAAGAFNSAANGRQVAVFTAAFRYDARTLAVVSTNPAVGGMFILPAPFTYDVNFNEPIDPASVQIGDLQLSGVAGATVTAATVQPGNRTVRFTITASVEGALTASIPAGAITDVFGNIGTAFTGNYSVDIKTLSYPTPLPARNPAGSLIYDGSVAGNIGFAGDSDSFTITLDPDQTVTAIVTGSGGLKASVKLLKSPFNAIIGGAIAAAADQPAVLQTEPTGGDGEHSHQHCFFHHPFRRFQHFGEGRSDHDHDHCPDFRASKTFTFKVSGANGTTGNYTLQLILNAAVELEGTIADKTNNTRAKAQNINDSFIKLQSSVASASRGAVLGANAGGPLAPIQTFDFESGEQGFVIDNGPLPGRGAGLWHLSTGRGAQSGHSAGASFYFGQGEGADGGGSYNVGATAGAITSAPIALPANLGISLSFNYVLQTEGIAGFDVASVQVSNDGGATFTTIASNAPSGQLPESGAWTNASYSLAAFAGQTVLIRFSFDTIDSVANAFEGWYVDDVQLSAPDAWTDYYSFRAGANDVVSVALENLTGAGANVFLEDEDGTVLATGVGGATSYDRGIGNFLIAAGGTHFLRVSGPITASYSLVVNRNAAFDTEENDTIATAQSLTGARGVIGRVTGGGETVSLQNFDDGQLTGYTTVVAPTNASVTAAAAHDGPFGLQIESSNGWFYRNDPAVATQRGDTISCWMQAAGAPGGGRAYIGFGASASGTLSLILGGNSGTFLLQRNANFTGFESLGEVPQAWEPNKWYRFEVVWGLDGSITGNLYDSDGTTLLNTVTGSDTTITSGGLAFRGFGPTYFVDTVQKGGSRNDDWYSITVLNGRLKLETSTPADGTGEFVNTLDPHIELYDSTGSTLLASGAATDDERNESLNYHGASGPATYLVRVIGEGGTGGEYFLGIGAPPPFQGFFSPITGFPYQAGSTIPVTFSFGANLGLDILAPGAPVSRPVNCWNGASLGDWEPTSGGLQFHPFANKYLYSWATNSSWARSCRELDVITKDGRRFRTKVKFR